MHVRYIYCLVFTAHHLLEVHEGLWDLMLLPLVLQRLIINAADRIFASKYVFPGRLHFHVNGVDDLQAESLIIGIFGIVVARLRLVAFMFIGLTHSMPRCFASELAGERSGVCLDVGPWIL